MHKLIICLSISLINSSLSLSFNSTIVEQKETSNFNTQRVWFCVSNKQYLLENSTLAFEARKNELSSSSTYEIQQHKNWEGGMFYFVDIPLKYTNFRILSFKDGTTIKTTKWVYNIYPSKLYEIWGDSDVVRTRTSDVHCPDAYILTLFLSAYLTYSQSYENGYSAFEEIKQNWLSFYAGNIRGTLADTYFYDYSKDDYKIKEQNPKKTVLKSAQDKINELKEAYDNNPHSESQTKIKNIIIGFVFFVLSFGIAFVIFLIIKKKVLKKNDAVA